MAVRILIVDDDKFTRAVLETILRQEPGFAGVPLEIVTAEDGQAGLASFKERPADVVIVDLLMPRLDGFETSKALRDTPAGKNAELVVMSGVYRDSAIRNRVHGEFGATFFAKPAQLKDLAKHVAQAVHRRQQATPARPSAGAAGGATAEPELPPRTGDLTLRPLPSVLLDLHETSATGRLILRRGRVTKVIEVADGNPVGATSSARDETLGHFLVGSGVITDEQHKQAVARAAQRREKVGEALVGLGILTPARLADLLTAQARHKLVQALRWPAGAWRFEPRPSDPSTDGVRLPMVEVILTGLRDTADPTTMPEIVAQVGNQALELTDRGQRLVADLRRVFGERIVGLLRPGVTMEGLERAGVERGAVYTFLDTLVLCDAITTLLPEIGPGFDRTDKMPRMDFPGESTEAFIERRLAAPVPDSSRKLYELLFEDTSIIDAPPAGDAPIDLGDGIPGSIVDGDSGLVDIGEVLQSVAQQQDTATAARRALLKEYLRIQGLDHYGVLLVDRRGTAAEIAAALAERQSRFAPEYYARFELGRDQTKLDEIRAAYEAARTVLLDDTARAAFDRELAGGDLGETAPSLDAELAYRAAEDLLSRRQFPAAIAKLTAAVQSAPDEADYHAVLGWAHWLAGGHDARAADAARPHLNRALAINPDHAAGHDFLGRIDATLGTDDALAAFHLERALDLEPGRTEALAALETIFLRHGDARPLERLYRRLLYRAQSRSAPTEVTLWMRLGKLYREHLDDVDGARAAYGNAQRLAPGDAAVTEAITDLERTARPLDQTFDELRHRWRRDLTAPQPGVEMMRLASEAERHDAAFLVASSLVALGEANASAEALYQRYKPRFVMRAHRPLTPELWNQLRHPDDGLELGALMELAAPVVRELTPMTLDDLEVDESMRVDDGDLPQGFLRMRSYLAGLFGVDAPGVFVRSDFGRQIHVGAVDPPVLLAGDDALAAPERGELAFRLARAMTYLWPGRAVGGSRPARFLKRVVLAIFADAAPKAAEQILADDPDAARAHEALGLLDEEARNQARAVVLRLVSRAPQFNLSRWARGLNRTADRAGLLACGDLPAAVRYAADSGAQGDDLIEFAISPAFLSLRTELGLSIDV